MRAMLATARAPTAAVRACAAAPQAGSTEGTAPGAALTWAPRMASGGASPVSRRMGHMRLEGLE